MKQKFADLINIVFGYRKFIAWLAVFIVAMIFRVKDLINGSEFSDLVKNTFLAFAAANGVEHLVSVAKEYINSKGQITVPTGDDIVDPIQPDSVEKQ